MITRKEPKIITSEEFEKEKKGIAYSDLEGVLCGDYVYILDSMDMEDFDYDDTSFDIFKEIVYENKVVGYVSYMEDKKGLCLIEAYVMPDYRGNGLLCKEISSNENLKIHMPKTGLVKALINCNAAKELSEGIVVSKIPFEVSQFQLNREDEYYTYWTHVYDLHNGCVLLLENPDSFNFSRSNRSEKIKSTVDDARLTKAYEIVSQYDEKYLKVTSEKLKFNVVFI